MADPIPNPSAPPANGAVRIPFRQALVKDPEVVVAKSTAFLLVGGFIGLCIGAGVIYVCMKKRP